MMSIVERLKALLEREPALRGDELEKLVLEKESLMSQLEEGLKLGEEGAAERLAGLEEPLAALSFANQLALKTGRIKAQLSSFQKPEAKAVPAKRLDLIS